MALMGLARGKLTKTIKQREVQRDPDRSGFGNRHGFPVSLKLLPVTLGLVFQKTFQITTAMARGLVVDNPTGAVVYECPVQYQVDWPAVAQASGATGSR